VPTSSSEPESFPASERQPKPWASRMASTSAAARSALRRCAVTVRSCSSSSTTCSDGLGD
jgi:hypothetical protein